MPDTTTALHQRLAAIERYTGSLRRSAKASGWQLNNSFDMHRFGGGRLMWQFDGHGVHIGAHNSIWIENNIGIGNYRAATYGGPNITLDGAAEYLNSTDAPWQETDTEELFVWSWCYPTSLASTGTVVAKYRWSSNNRSWQLRYDLAATEFLFLCNATSLAAGNVTVTSTHGAVVVDQWYFVAGYFEASTLMRVYVAQNTDIALTVDSLAVGVPASLFDGTAPLTIGADGNPANYFTGNIGKVLGRGNVPSANIDDHANLLFQSTRDFYAE